MLKGSLGDVKSRVDLPQSWLAYQRQTAQPQVCVQGVWAAETTVGEKIDMGVKEKMGRGRWRREKELV